MAVSANNMQYTIPYTYTNTFKYFVATPDRDNKS